MKKETQEKSGVARCQRCLKYGHYTYECQNDVAYRYRPSRTVLFKQKIKLKLNQDKGPKTVILNPDYKRRTFEDVPSSQSQKQGEKQQQKADKGQKGPQDEQEIKNSPQNKSASESEEEEESSSDSSDESLSSSSSSSSESSSEESKPRKMKKLS